MTSYTVHQGKRYRAVIRLGLLEQLAGNNMIRETLVDAGFVDVEVSGHGATRHAEATWPNEDASAPMPSQIAQIEEIA